MFSRDILIGAVDNYTWNQIKPWVSSAREVGFTGDIYLITYRISDDTKRKATDAGVILYECDHTPYGTTINHDATVARTQSHNIRFYHAWELLTRLDPSDYRYVIMTDVRDVIFQRNPVEKLVSNNIGQEGWYDFMASSEGIKFKHEEWNKDNLIKGFGQVFYDVVNADEWIAYNVGVLAGTATLMTNLCHLIFTMTEGRYYPSDQSSYNVLLRNGFFDDRVIFNSMTSSWAAQLGTTLDPTKQWLWTLNLDERPRIKDGLVQNEKYPYYIVHQWDRVPELKAMIEKKYEI